MIGTQAIGISVCWRRGDYVFGKHIKIFPLVQMDCPTYRLDPVGNSGPLTKGESPDRDPHRPEQAETFTLEPGALEPVSSGSETGIMISRIGSIYLLLNGLLFLGLGVAYLLMPVRMAAKTDFVLSSDVAVIELRAIYGGMEVAVGALLVFCALRNGWMTSGLVFTAIVYGGFVAGRVIGMIAADNPGGMTWKLLAFEVTDLLIGLALLISGITGTRQ